MLLNVLRDIQTAACKRSLSVVYSKGANWDSEELLDISLAVDQIKPSMCLLTDGILWEM